MKRDEFDLLFPYADRQRFYADYDGTMVFDEGNDVVDDIEFIAFWDNPEKVKYLHLPVLGWRWYSEHKEKFLAFWRRRQHFLQHGVKPQDLNPLVSRSTSPTQRWGPPEWDRSTLEKTPPIHLNPNVVDLNHFRVYVNAQDYFMFQGQLPDFGNVDEINFDDPKNVYCLGLKAMYILSYLGGLSQKNLESDTPLAKSLAHFYFYYHLQKFYNYREFKQYNTLFVEQLHWDLYDWRSRFVWYHPQAHYTKDNLKRNDSDIIDHIHHVGNKVYYDIRVGKRNLSNDYLKLLQATSHGLTSLGQVLFQESSQAYVYCILGAQAKTHWKIVGDSANSLQTQVVFHDLVKEVVVQNDLSKLIKSMRVAIDVTRVRLDFCISPGLELLPSDMVFIKDSPGYNNILRVSSEKQRFGVNNVNTTLRRVPVGLGSTDPPSVKPDKTPPSTQPKIPAPQGSISNGAIGVTTIFLVVVGRVLWALI